MSKIIRDDYLLDDNYSCYACNYTWDRQSYTQWHHLIEDHHLELMDQFAPTPNVLVSFNWRMRQRVLR